MKSSKLRSTAVIFFLILAIALSTPTQSAKSASSDKIKTLLIEKTQNVLNLSAA